MEEEKKEKIEEKIEVNKEKIEEKKEEKIEIEKEKIEVKNEEKRKFTINFNFDYVIVILLIIIVAFSIYLRTQNIPYLKDITTGNYTLGPDLDPFLYLRHAREIIAGKLQEPDMMRAAPLGSNNYAKTNLMPWAIVFIYKFLDIFFSPPIATIEFAAIIAPVIFFSLTLIIFFLFVKQVFKPITNKSAIIALIATAFYAVIPTMLHRTTAGIPEIESLGMLWFWLAFLFFTLAWQSNKLKNQIIYSILAGIFTGLMIYTWGGFRYIFMSFSLASFLIFLFQKDKRKNIIIFTSWLIPALIFSITKFGFKTTLTNITDTGFAIGMFILFIFDKAFNKIKLHEKIEKRLKLPESILTIIIVLVAGILLLLIFKPSSLIKISSKVIEGMLYPFGRGRIGVTVAENQPPYLYDVFASFSFLFFIFIIGIIFMFYEATKHFDKKQKILLNTFFIVFIFTFIFSRISPNTLLDGENFISKFLYFGGLLVFAFVLLIIYIKAYLEDIKIIEDFKAINFTYILLLSFTFWMIVSMRGAIRLFFIISPSLIICSSFLLIKIYEYTKTKDEFKKAVFYFILIFTLFILIFTFINFTKETKQEARWTVPFGYYQQWQKAMAWVRENTSKDAIFAHWWDYGYWVQTIGERATVLDGGHPVSFWNHLMGREVLTTPEPITALQFMYAHNVSYLLLDPTDIGKYAAFSSIGSDVSGRDRYSYIPTFILDERLTEEKRNSTTYTFIGGSALDEDLIVNDTVFPAFSSNVGIAGFKLTIEEGILKQPEILIIYRGKVYKLNLRYIYYNKKLYDFNSGIEGILYVIPYTDGSKINSMGAALWLSPKVSRGLFAKLYLLNESFNGTIQLAYQQDDLIVEQLKQQGIVLSNDIVLFRGSLLGPIRIYKINYPKDFEVPKEKLTRYLSFKSDLPFALW